MPILATMDEANVIVETHNGTEIKLREFIGKLGEVARGPQAVTASQPAGFISSAHFHRVDGFQVVIEGSTAFPDHEATPGTVHYTDAFTPYGPFEAGTEGITMFVLRARHDVGSQYMPESRKLIARRGGREIFANCRLKLTDDIDEMRLHSVIDLREDDLAAYEMVAPPGVPLLDSTASGSGRYQVVLDGDVHMDGRVLPKHSIGFIPPGNSFGRRTAGPRGAHLLEVQLPRE